MYVQDVSEMCVSVPRGTYFEQRTTAHVISETTTAYAQSCPSLLMRHSYLPFSPRQWSYLQTSHFLCIFDCNSAVGSERRLRMRSHILFVLGTLCLVLARRHCELYPDHRSQYQHTVQHAPLCATASHLHDACTVAVLRSKKSLRERVGTLTHG